MTLAPVSQYTAQSPRPHSPPHTPSSASGSHIALPTTTLEHGTIELATPATTPEPTTTFAYPAALHPGGSALDRRTSTSSTRSHSHSRASTPGMGITFPADNNPLPSELSEGKKQPEPVDMARSLSDTATASGQPTPSSSGMAASRSAVGGNYEYIHGQTLQAGSTTTHRPRSNSPSPSKPLSASSSANANGFASSSSFHPSSLSAETRERIVSPTRPSFEKMQDQLVPPISIPSLGGVPASEGSPLWSPAIDGKKEPSIKPAPFGYDAYNPDLYAHPGAKNRARSPFPANGAGVNGQGQNGLAKVEYQPHPLTGGQAYNQATAKEVRAAGGFYDSVGYWLGLYFFFNLGLTLFNKIVLVSFPFPYTLTGLHALSGCAGCYFALERGAFVPARLTQKESLILAAFSVLYTINIAVSNISLQLVTVPFHQVVRASTPLFTILISTVLLRTRFSLMKLVSLLPVVAGVGFATYGDYYFTAWGLILTLLGTFLAALKTVVTNLIQTGGGQRLKLHPLDLLMRMSPLAFIQCVAYGWYTGELERVRRYGATQMTRSKAIALLVNGVIACGLNIVSFTANKKAGALTMTVSANCKQVLTIALAVFLFDLSISPTNGVGILLTLIGGGWYGYVEYQEKNKKAVKLVDRS